MVDELELLKKDWKRQEASLPKVTAKEIYPMLLKKSSSIVKWIFIISMIEFAFWLVCIFFLSGIDYGTLQVQSTSLKIFETIFNGVHLSILVFFIYKFYRNFTGIKSTDSASQLMKNILRTRKTVKHYILASLILFVIASIITTKLIVDLNMDVFNVSNGAVLVLTLISVLTIFVLLLWFLYNKIYGLLVKRLNKNYEELKKMEV